MNMNKQDALKQYEETREKIAAYRLALNTTAWDNATVAPKKGASYRNQMMAILSGELFSIETSIDYLNLIDEMSSMDLEEDLKREISQIKKEQDKSKYIPKDVYVEYAQLLHDGETLWEEAKEKKDYQLFKGMLKNLVEMTKKVVSYRHDNRSVYDQLLDDFETDFNTEKYDEFFTKLKTDLVPLIHQINALKTQRFSWLNETVSVDVHEKQSL
jgi:carboxypeptidase Taq